MKLPIGIQIYSVRDFCYQNLENTLKEIKSYGYEGVELAGLYERTPKQMAELLSEYGLEPISAHVSYYDMKADMEKVISDYKTVGCKYIAIPWMDPDYRLNGIYGKETMENICKFAEMAKSADIPLLYHNHSFEFEKIGDDYIFDLIYAQAPNLMVEQDSCWVHEGGQDPLTYLKKYANRTPVLHLKDYVGSKKDGTFELRPNGYGVVDIKGLVEASPDCGVEWLVVEQDHPSMGMNAFECAQKSIEYLKQL